MVTVQHDYSYKQFDHKDDSINFKHSSCDQLINSDKLSAYRVFSICLATIVGKSNQLIPY